MPSEQKIIVIPDGKICDYINDLALEANEKRYQAYLLEQEALQIMDRDVIYAKK